MMQRPPPSSHRTEDFGQRLSDAVRDNPIPAALVGMGVLWLFMGGNRTTISQMAKEESAAGRDAKNLATGVGSKVADTSKQSGEALLHAGSSAAKAVSETATSMMSGANEVVSDAADAMQRGGTHMVSSLQRDLTDLFERRPLAVGALGLVVGAAIGTAFAPTQAEVETFGEASQALKNQAENLVSAGLETAREASTGLTGQTTSKMGATASEAARSGAQKVAAVAESALHAVQDQLRTGVSDKDK